MTDKDNAPRTPTPQEPEDARTQRKDLEVKSNAAAKVKAGRSPDPQEGGE